MTGNEAFKSCTDPRPLDPYYDSEWDAHCRRHQKREDELRTERDLYKAALEEIVRGRDWDNSWWTYREIARKALDQSTGEGGTK